MRLSRSSSAGVYLAIYTAAAALLGTALIVTHGPTEMIILLAIPIILTSALYPRRVYYTLMLATMIAVTGIHLTLATVTSLNTIIGIVLSEISVLLISELMHRFVIEQARARETLAESKEQWRAILSNIPDIIYSLDEKESITTINDAALERLEYRYDDLLGKPFATIVHPEDRETIARAREQASAEDRQYVRDLQIRVLGKDGAVYWVEMSAYIRFDGKGSRLQEHGVLRDFTRRKRIEESLTESQQALLTLMSNLPGAAYRYRNDDQWTIEFISEGCIDLTGYRPEELIGNRVIANADLIHPDDRKTIQTEIDAAIGEGRPFQLTFRIKTRSETEKWIWIKGRQVDLRDDIAILEGFMIDITERRLAEEALRASEERYRSVSELTSDFAASFVVGPNGTPVLEWITDAFTRITGYTPSEVNPASGMSKIAYPDDMAIAQEHRDRLLAGQPSVCEYRIITKDGNIRWLRDFCHPVLDDRQERVIRIYWAAQDITVPIMTAEALWASEHKYESLVNAIDGIVWEWDVKSQHFSVVSQQSKRLLGYAPEDWMSDPLFWEDHLHPEDREWAMSFRRQACETMQSYECQYRMLAADGRAVWVRDMVSVVSDEGQPAQLRGIMIDTTYQKLADEETSRLNVELGQRNIHLLTLYETNRALSSTLELHEIYRVMYSEVAQNLLGEPHFLVALFDEMTRTITAKYAVVDGQEIDSTELPGMPLGNGPNSETIRTRQPRIVDLEEVEQKSKACLVQVGDERQTLSAVYVPMIQGDRVIGVLNIQSYKRKAFDHVDMTLLTTLANQAAIAIENARLIESERRQLRLAKNLQAVGSLLTAEMSLDEVLERIFDLLVEVIAYSSVSVQLMGSDDRLYFSAWRGFPDIEHAKQVAEKIANVPFEERWGQRSIVVIPDTKQDPRWDRSLGSGRVRSWIGAPLWVKGRFIGVLNVDHTQPHIYNAETASTVEAFANQAAIAIENARLFTESEERNQRLALINKITRTGATILNVTELSQALVDVVAGIIGSDECYLTMWDARRQLPIPIAASGPLRDTYRSAHVEPNEQTLTASVLKAGRPLIADNVLASPYMSPSVSLSLGMPSEACMLGVPLHAEGEDLGALLIAFTHGHQYTEEEIAWAVQAGELIALALSKAIAYTDLEKRVAERTAELVGANERLLALTKLKDEFVSNVSHELRTPIASIKLYLRLLTLRPEKEAAYLDRLNRETNRLEHIIEDLLQLSRIDQGHTQLKLTPTNFNWLARQFVTDRTPLAEERGLKLILKPKPKLPLVQADEMLLGQALSILLTNALNYTPSGGYIELRTRTRQTDKSRWAGLSVQDTGPGIPPDEAPRLFQRFFRGKVGRESGAPGTGLGLAIAKQIIEWHGGQIEVASKGIPGEGVTFTIWLPVEASAAKLSG